MNKTFPLVMLDRDGVINYDSDFYIKSAEEWHPIPGSLDAIAQLNRHGYQVVVVTNQSGIARGFYDLAKLDEIHEKLINELAAVGGYVDEIFFCPHHPDDRCNCRKPKLGLFYQIQKKYDVNLTEAYFIGDSVSDMQAAVALGCKPLLVLTGNGQKVLDHHPEFATIPHFANLATAVDYIILKR